jgi:hypothetical protein
VKKTGKRYTPKQNPLAVRRYDIKGMTYVVSAYSKEGATEDASTIVRRLIRKEIGRTPH